MAAIASAHEPRVARRTRSVRRLCLAVPAAVLLGSYAWLALDHGTLALWSVVVHESGLYTLEGTILYFAHFLREVPTIIAYALFLLSMSGGAAQPAIPRAGREGARWAALAGAAAIIGVAVLATARADGLRSALLDLLQYRTRDDLVEYGSHWRFHWLSTLWFGAVAAVAPVALRRITGGYALQPHRTWLIAAWGWFALLTIIFGISGDVFVDVRYAGHQAREIMTHAPITGMLGIGVLLCLRRPRTPSQSRPALHPWLSAALAPVVLLVPAYVALVALSGDVMVEGQADQGLGGMVAAHYFEHSLDYLTVLLLMVAGLSPADLPTQYERADAASDHDASDGSA